MLISKYVCLHDHYMQYGVFLLLGTNLGDRASNLERAIDLLASESLLIKGISFVYKTAAWGKQDQPDFYNQVLEVATSLSPHELLTYILSIERQMGRVRVQKWGERVIDIDILLYGEHVVESPSLTIPHPQLPFRRFSLVPLADLAASLVHPLTGKSISRMIDECPDTLEVIRLD